MGEEEMCGREFQSIHDDTHHYYLMNFQEGFYLYSFDGISFDNSISTHILIILSGMKDTI